MLRITLVLEPHCPLNTRLGLSKSILSSSHVFIRWRYKPDPFKIYTRGMSGLLVSYNGPFITPQVFPFPIAVTVQYADVSLRGPCPVDHSVTPTLSKKVKNCSGI